MNAPDPINRYSRAVQRAPLPVLPSMLRQRRICRIQLRHLTNSVGQRYAREATPGSER